MASGLSKRFGSNKLLADFAGEPLFLRTLKVTDNQLFADRIVVTRTPEIQALCQSRQISVLLHDFPGRNDTVRLGLQALPGHSLTGCVFCPGDQPLLSRESIATLCQTFSQNSDFICRLGTEENPGAPVIFPFRLFAELLTLPQGKGGSFLAKKYPEQVLYVPARDEFELLDADTPETLNRLLQIYSDCKAEHDSDNR